MGCNVWAFLPDTLKNPCAVVYDYPGPDATDKCPAGHPDVGFRPALGLVANYAGGGPCAAKMYNVNNTP
jgi:hypothetical protein